ncbi:TetR family transcriptional regulator [Cystobacter fuscus]|uniref:TetR family transcriptional regulator n=1 Tax=Cystobacter fuscus TaxID=43 RepID=UPI0012FD6748|nr:TetR family transcriptional regulator [Cystobacter fuscus]
MQQKVQELAFALFAEHGFDATTVEQIAAETGVSRATLFRYFGTKEDIVLGDTAEQCAVLTTAFAARPPEEDVWISLQRAAEALPSAQSPEHARQVAMLVHSSASLRSRYLVKMAAWQEVLVPLVEQRLGAQRGTRSRVRAAAIVACSLACLDVAADALRHSAELTLDQLYGEAVSAVRGPAGPKS